MTEAEEGGRVRGRDVEDVGVGLADAGGRRQDEYSDGSDRVRRMPHGCSLYQGAGWWRECVSGEMMAWC